MKNISLFLNAVLLIAVGILYYLYFSSHRKPEPLPVIPVGNNGTTHVVYVNVDTLFKNYVYYKKMKDAFEKKRIRFEEEIGRQSKVLETEYTAAQQKAQLGQMTEKEMQEAEQKLLKKQQEIMSYKELQEQALIKENEELTETLLKKITEYLKKINTQYHYQFILGYTKGGGILLANDSLDITKYVIEGLNKEQENDN